MWSGTLHDKEFLARVLEHVEANKDKYGTYDRMKGMVTLAKEVCGADVWQSSSWLNGYSGTRCTILLHARPSLRRLPLCLPFDRSNNVSLKFVAHISPYD